MNVVVSYFQRLQSECESGWNQFWFATASPYTLAKLRIGSGLLALGYFASWEGYLERWFTPAGFLPTETVQSLLLQSGQRNFHWSVLNYLQTPVALQIFLIISCVVASLLTLGILPRVFGWLTWLAVLSYVHRAPMITGPFESVLTMLLCYVPIGACGDVWSLSPWRPRQALPVQTWGTHVALRLIQLHTAGFFLLVGHSALGAATWWNGTAVWALAAQTGSRMLDLSSLRTVPLFVNVWTHAFVAANLLLPILVWNRLWRPLVLITASGLWLSMIPLTGQPHYCLAMILASMAFCTRDTTQPLRSEHGRA